MKGWIKVHRALAEHHVASDPGSLSVWIHILLLANHRETKRQINGRVVNVLAGQLITSRKSISTKTGVNESKVERVLKMLQSEHLIEQHGTSKFRVISITNWDTYQQTEQQDEQPVNSRRTASEQQVNTPEEILPAGSIQEGKECKEKKTTPSKLDVADQAFDSFWNLYPKKVSKVSARKAWKKVRPAEYQIVMAGLAAQVSSQGWKKDDGQWVPNPATWLNAERWNDEVKNYDQRPKSGGSLSAVEQVRAGIAGREIQRQGDDPEYSQQDFIEGEFYASR